MNTYISRPIIDRSREGLGEEMKERQFVQVANKDELEALDRSFQLTSNIQAGNKSEKESEARLEPNRPSAQETAVLQTVAHSHVRAPSSRRPLAS